MFFQSDNCNGVHPKILAGLLEIDHKFQSPYGSDLYTELLQKKISDIFEKEVKIFFASTGTAANGLALSSLVKPTETIFCSEVAHLDVNENTGPSFFTGGASLTLIKSMQGKIDLISLQRTIIKLLESRPHGKKPGCISITQSTELGTVYSLEELEKLNQLALTFNLPIHMDGARFVNSLVALGCSPSDLTWKKGVDVLSFGATKNGALCAELVIFFNKNRAEYFDYQIKRTGQQFSKSAFFAKQFLSYFEDSLWLSNAIIANGFTKKLYNVFIEQNFDVIYPVQTNQLFVRMPRGVAAKLMKNGCKFYLWGEDAYRFVTSWNTTDDDIMSFRKLLNMLNV